MFKSDIADYYVVNYMMCKIRQKSFEELLRVVMADESGNTEVMQESIINEIKGEEGNLAHYLELIQHSCDSEEDLHKVVMYVEDKVNKTLPHIHKKEQEIEEKALDEIDAKNRDMISNPDSYFEADDPRRRY